MHYRIESNASEIARELERFGEKAAGRAHARAINRAAVTARTSGSRQVREHLAIKASDIKGGFATLRARPNHPLAILRISSRPLSLVSFPHTQRAEGVAVKVLRAGPKKVARHTFLARMASGHVGIFLRRSGTGGRAARLPIDETVTKSLAQVLGDTGRLRTLADAAEKTYAKELAHQLGLERAR